jgi:glucose-6-phosphate 1-dehydrogenase
MAQDSRQTVEIHPSRIKQRMPPCALVIFGGAGDLSHRKLLPALYNLSIDNELPEHAAVVGFSIEDLNDDSYRQFARSGIEQFSRRPLDESNWSKFAPLLHFVRGDFTDASTYSALRTRLEEIDQQAGTHENRVFYFAIPPSFIDTCSNDLKASGMIQPADVERAPSTRARFSASITISARRRSRTCWYCALRTRSSNRCGHRTLSITCRSR